MRAAVRIVLAVVARRLLIVLLVLFGISILATALAPQRSDDEKTPSQTATATGAAPPPADTDPPVAVTINADRKSLDVVPLKVGQHLELDVASKTVGTVEIPAFGLVQAVDPSTPAHFDLLLEQPGEFAVKLVEEKRLAGRLDVSPAARPGKAPGK